jgi:hypothetical protein
VGHDAEGAVSARGPVRRGGPGRYRLRLSAKERDAVSTFSSQLRTLLTSQDQASDPAVARLFPAAYPDDVIRNLEWERANTDSLLLGKLEALDVIDRTMSRDELTEDELLAWLESLNSMRLVLGTRLNITEESEAGDYADDEQTAGLFDLYSYFTWLEASIVDVLAEGIEPEG